MSLFPDPTLSGRAYAPRHRSAAAPPPSPPRRPLRPAPPPRSWPATSPSPRPTTAPSRRCSPSCASASRGGNYRINTGNGYYGAYQFNQSTWNGVGGTGRPDHAAPEVQDEMATRLYERRGWSPWPSCSRSRGLHATTVERPWADKAPRRQRRQRRPPQAASPSRAGPSTATTTRATSRCTPTSTARARSPWTPQRARRRRAGPRRRPAPRLRVHGAGRARRPPDLPLRDQRRRQRGNVALGCQRRDGAARRRSATSTPSSRSPNGVRITGWTLDKDTPASRPARTSTSTARARPASPPTSPGPTSRRRSASPRPAATTSSCPPAARSAATRSTPPAARPTRCSTAWSPPSPTAVPHRRPAPVALRGGWPLSGSPGGRPYGGRVRTSVIDHPLVAHKLTVLRDARTDSPTFRRLADELVTLLAYEATRDVRVEPVEVDTPVARATGCRLAKPVPLVVPVLRAGLGMLDGMTRLLPTAEVGFLGMVRDETRSSRPPTRPGCRRTCPGARSSCSTRCSPRAARWSRRSSCSSTAAPRRSPPSACWRRPRASPASTRRSPTTPAARSPWSRPASTSGSTRAATSPRSRRRRRPPLRRRLTMVRDWSSLAAALAPYGEPVELLRLPAPLVESSGVASSSRSDDVLFTHQDSGDEAQFYAVSSAAGCSRRTSCRGCRRATGRTWRAGRTSRGAAACGSRTSATTTACATAGCSCTGCPSRRSTRRRTAPSSRPPRRPASGSGTTTARATPRRCWCTRGPGRLYVVTKELFRKPGSTPPPSSWTPPGRTRWSASASSTCRAPRPRAALTSAAPCGCW